MLILKISVFILYRKVYNANRENVRLFQIFIYFKISCVQAFQHPLTAS